MDKRLYFIAGDILANLIAALAGGVLAWWLVDTGWNMWLAMVIAMILGMVAGAVLFFPLSLFFGAMEVMIPVMVSAMVAGMVIGMWCAMSYLSVSSVAMISLLSGLGITALLWSLNGLLRGPVDIGGGL